MAHSMLTTDTRLPNPSLSSWDNKRKDGVARSCMKAVSSVLCFSPLSNGIEVPFKPQPNWVHKRLACPARATATSDGHMCTCGDAICPATFLPGSTNALGVSLLMSSLQALPFSNKRNLSSQTFGLQCVESKYKGAELRGYLTRLIIPWDRSLHGTQVDGRVSVGTL
jgi:hypothetical protein